MNWAFLRGKTIVNVDTESDPNIVKISCSDGSEFVIGTEYIFSGTYRPILRDFREYQLG